MEECLIKRELRGFRVIVIPDTTIAEEKVKALMRGYGARYLRSRSDGTISGTVKEKDVDAVHGDFRKLLKSTNGKILEVTVAPLYS